MVAVTYGGARAAAPAKSKSKSASKSVAKGRGFFMRALDAVAQAQMKRAEREMYRYRHLLPPGFKFTSHTDEPFGGW